MWIILCSHIDFMIYHIHFPMMKAKRKKKGMRLILNCNHCDFKMGKVKSMKTDGLHTHPPMGKFTALKYLATVARYPSGPSGDECFNMFKCILGH